MTVQTDRLGITGASGRLAAMVLEQLLDVRGLAPQRVVAATRSPDRLEPLARRGVDVRHADFDDPTGLEQAFAGVDRLLLISTDDIFPQGARARQQAAAVAAAAKAGVQHIVYTSAPNPEPPNPMFWEQDHWRTEQAIRSSGCGWTFLRNSEYMEIHLERHWPDAIAAGELHTIAGEGRCAYVSRVDCALAAAAALDSTSAENRVWDVTGPQALTADEAMRTVSDVIGRPIRVVHTTPDDYRAILAEQGQPDWLIPCWIGLDQGIEQGYFAGVSDAVMQLTGKPATALRTVVEREANPTRASM